MGVTELNLGYKRSKLKLRVFLAGHIVAMVTYCVTNIIDHFHKWRLIINSFESIKISLTNLILKLVIQKNFTLKRG